MRDVAHITARVLVCVKVKISRFPSEISVTRTTWFVGMANHLTVAQVTSLWIPDGIDKTLPADATLLVFRQQIAGLLSAKSLRRTYHNDRHGRSEL